MNGAKLQNDIIIQYVNQHHDQIGVDEVNVVYYIEGDNGDEPYLRNGCFMSFYSENLDDDTLSDFWKILVYLDQNPPPQEVLAELNSQLMKLNLGNFTSNLLDYIYDNAGYEDEQEIKDFPDFIPDLFRLIKKFCPGFVEVEKNLVFLNRMVAVIAVL